MKTIFAGTIVLAIQTHDAVYIGVDSKVISIGAEISDALPAPKIHQLGNVVFAHAGIFRDTAGKIDVKATADASIAAGGSLMQISDRFASSIEPQLSASLPDVRTGNPTRYKEMQGRPLQMLFASARGGSPQTVVVYFEVIDPCAEKLTVRVTRKQCPGDCPKNAVTTIALGKYHAADRFLDAHPEILGSRGAVAAIKEAIASQASDTPDFVSLPAVVVWTDRLGIYSAN